MTGYIHMRLRKHTSIAAMLRTFFRVNRFVGGSDGQWAMGHGSWAMGGGQ